MAALGIGIGFAALGGAVGATGVAGLTIQAGVSIGLTVGSVVASLAFGGDAPAVKGPRLGDTKVQVSTYGVGLAIVHGSVRTAGNVTYMPVDGIREVKEEQGGKGGIMGGGSVTTYKYFATFEVAFCEGPIDDVIAIWADSKLIFDQRENVKLKKRFKKMGVTVRKGEETQLPSSVWETEFGAGEVPGGRGVASVLIEDLPLLDFGNRIPNITALVARASTTVLNAFIDWNTSGAPAINADGYVIDVKRGNLVSMGFSDAKSYFVRYDPLSGRYLNDSKDQPGQQFGINNIVHAIDPDTGRLYGIGDPEDTQPITLATAVRYNPTSLIREAWGTDFVTNPNNGCVVNGALLHYLEGGVTANGRIYTFGKVTLDLIWTRDPVVDYGYARIRTMVADRDGYLWAAGSVTGDSEYRLYQIAPSGSLVQTWDFETEMTASAGFDLILRIAYDSYRHRLILTSPVRDTMAIFDIGTKTLSPVLSSIGVSGQHMSSLQLAPSRNGRLWMHQTNAVWNEFDVTDMTTGPTLVRSINPQDHDNAATTYFSILLDEDRQMLLCLEDVGVGNAQFQFLPLDRKNPAGTTLAAVVSDLCAHAGLEVDDIDVTELTDTVNGYVAARQSSARDMIEPLVKAYFFDGYQGDAKIKFIKRGGAVDHTVLQDDTAAHEPDSELPPVLSKKRAQETEVPKRINVRFMDLNEDYQEGQQSDGREVTDSKGEIKIELPLALTADDAKTIATKILREAMVNRDEREMHVGPKHWDIDPTDIVFIEET